ncbi:MAG TPA: hypothetical protein VNC59_07900 [Thermoanaerobaculia bacterium]|nr:hypothetical protein [Thermoanaerobaculia bacterium]
MASGSPGRAGALLWLVAAALAFIAAVVAYTRTGELKVTLLGATLFFAAMGFGFLRRSRRNTPGK